MPTLYSIIVILTESCTGTGMSYLKLNYVKNIDYFLMDAFVKQFAPGLFIRNDTLFPILVVLSQLTPLHWLKVEANQTAHINCGRVFFTVSTAFFDEKSVPRQSLVALRIAVITAATVFTGNMDVIN